MEATQQRLRRNIDVITKKRMTSLEKVLFGVVILLAIVCSMFIMMFAVLGINQSSSDHDVKVQLQRNIYRGRRYAVRTDDLEITNLTMEADDDATVDSACGRNDASVTGTNKSRQRICISDDCVKTASNMLHYIDKEVDPCQDFYSYACGNWANIHPLPDEATFYDTFAVLKQDIRQKLKDLLEQPIEVDDSHAMTAVKHFYISCMNETLIGERKEEPLMTLLDDLGGWPVITRNWSTENFNWVDLMAKLRLYNNDILIAEGIGPDKRNSSRHVIQIDQAALGMPVPEYFISRGKYVEAYTKYMLKTAVLLGADRKTAKKQLNKVIEFETMLANITIKDEMRRNIYKIYRKLKMKDLIKEVPQIDWLRYFNAILPKNVDVNEEIVAFAMDYFKRLGVLIENTDPRVVANYLIWRFVFNRNFNLDKRFQKIQMEYYRVLYGAMNPPARWMKCTSYVNQNMGMAVGAAFVQKYFTKGSKEQAIEMIDEIRLAFNEMLQNASWMNEEAKQAARAKVQKITEKIGYPNFILNATVLDEYYSKYNMHPDKFFENVLENLRLKTENEHLKYNTTVDRTRWMTSPADVNAYYTRTQNMISFPAGILQPPLYSKHYPRALNYGGIGVVIGHEITHGFDDKGRQFDEEGNLNEWWSEDIVKTFEKQASCFIRQYSNYSVAQVNVSVNGLRTVGENIADNAGIKQAFLAYKRWSERNGEEAQLPGLNLTNYQLFFLNFAQVWCGTGRFEAMVYKLRTGVHTPGRYRVTGSLSNFDEFSRAFDCPLGSPMNPEKKCTIW